MGWRVDHTGAALESFCRILTLVLIFSAFPSLVFWHLLCLGTQTLVQIQPRYTKTECWECPWTLKLKWLHNPFPWSNQHPCMGWFWQVRWELSPEVTQTLILCMFFLKTLMDVPQVLLHSHFSSVLHKIHNTFSCNRISLWKSNFLSKFCVLILEDLISQ